MSTSEVSESADSMDEDISQAPRARRSKVWEHYEQDLVRVHGDLKDVCKYCGTQLHTKFGTTGLRTHIAESCRSIEDGCRKSFLLTMKRTPSEGPFVFDQKVCRDLMVKFCIHTEIPFLKFQGICSSSVRLFRFFSCLQILLSTSSQAPDMTFSVNLKNNDSKLKHAAISTEVVV